MKISHFSQTAFEMTEILLQALSDVCDNLVKCLMSKTPAEHN